MSVSRNSTIPLNEVPAGASATVSEIRGGGNFLSRLATLGFTPGAQLAMIQNFGHGPLIVTIRDTRIALGRGEAAKVLVVANRIPSGT
jgi:ferrous iron transport protein A